MLRPRIIPCLLVHNGGLVKTRGFRDPKYVGDPINAVKIFNEKQADELIVLDIDATVQKRTPDFDLIAKLAAECRMPLCYGGGVTTVDQAVRIVSMGIEKVAISSAAIRDNKLISRIAAAVGRQSVVAVLDIRRRANLLGGRFEACTSNAMVPHKFDPLALAKDLENAGAGEILINSIDRDGSMLGFDIDMAVEFRRAIKVPITILGGASSLDDIGRLFSRVGIVGAAVGSLFVFKGKYRAVLINYPTPEEKMKICSGSEMFRQSCYV
jgi:cyclase